MAYGNDVEKRIRALLDLYFEGETTLAQEDELRRFFDGEEIPADLEYARAMFAGFASMARLQCDKDVNIDASASGVPAGKAAGKPSGRIRKIYLSVSVAAALLIAGGLAWGLAEPKPVVYCYLNGEPVTSLDAAERQAQMAIRLLQGSARASAQGLETAREMAQPMERIGHAAQMINAVVATDAQE